MTSAQLEIMIIIAVTLSLLGVLASIFSWAHVLLWLVGLVAYIGMVLFLARVCALNNRAPRGSR